MFDYRGTLRVPLKIALGAYPYKNGFPYRYSAQHLIWCRGIAPHSSFNIQWTWCIGQVIDQAHYPSYPVVIIFVLLRKRVRNEGSVMTGTLHTLCWSSFSRDRNPPSYPRGGHRFITTGMTSKRTAVAPMLVQAHILAKWLIT